MNRAKMIKKIIGESAENLGFYYKGASRDGGSTDYVFLRKKENEYETPQRIWFIIFDWYRGGWDIRMTFIGTKHIEAYRLIDSEFQEGFSGDCLHFKDEEELEQILYLFKRILSNGISNFFKE